jgi:A/G-specific adenine glycosylase
VSARSFAADLLSWYRRARRDLPWRRNADPYRVWVSEIMLQQTRAQTVIPYYERFLARFPTVESLAAAREEDVLALWSGLGYYSRARNLARAARLVAAAGAFPDDEESLRALPGVGEYTAAAIASIAFGRRSAAVDGNVLRVLARIGNDFSDIGAPLTRARLRDAANALLDRRDPGGFNQAMMELGATVCLPRNPLCGACPVAAWCRARAEGTVTALPVKLHKTELVRLEREMLIVRRNGRVLLRREDAGARRLAGFLSAPAPEHMPAARLIEALGDFRHSITRHRYTFFVTAAAPPQGPLRGKEWRWFRPSELDSIPLASAARKALRLAGIC